MVSESKRLATMLASSRKQGEQAALRLASGMLYEWIARMVSAGSTAL